MQTNFEVNHIQASIMRQLFFHDRRRFAQLNVGDVSSDQFSYHLRQLIKYGLIEKADQGYYTLSVLGRSRAHLLNAEGNAYIEQGFVALRIVLARTEAGRKQYLVQERRLVPFRGSYGLPGHKVLFGEDVLDAARRIMVEQTGLKCSMKLCGLTHYKDIFENRIVQDKYFFVVKAAYQQGRLQELGAYGNRNLWIDEAQIEAAPQTMPGTVSMIAMAGTAHLEIDERTFEYDSY